MHEKKTETNMEVSNRALYLSFIFIYLFICLFVYLFVYLFIHLFIYLFIYLSKLYLPLVHKIAFAKVTRNEKIVWAVYTEISLVS